VTVQRRVRSYVDFMAFLRAKHRRIKQSTLGVEGRNRVLYRTADDDPVDNVATADDGVTAC
jgi:hypothetical protein